MVVSESTVTTPSLILSFTWSVRSTSLPRGSTATRRLKVVSAGTEMVTTGSMQAESFVVLVTLTTVRSTSPGRMVPSSRVVS